MEVTYIKEISNWTELLGRRMKTYPVIVQKFCFHIKRLFGICNIIKTEENNKLVILPYTTEELLKRTIWYKKQLKKEKNVVLSKVLFRYKEFNIKNINSKIWDGKWLFPYLVIETIEYICSKSEKPMEQTNVAIMVSDTTEQNIQAILQLTQRVKSLSVITKRIAKFRQIEKNLYQEKGIAIKLSSNKRKSLKKEKIIINMDLKQEELNSYDINKKAIVIHIRETVNNLPRGFCGININQFEIVTREKRGFSEFLCSHRYETKIYQKVGVEYIQHILEQDKVKIAYLIGQRGRIEEQEYKRLLTHGKDYETFCKMY